MAIYHCEYCDFNTQWKFCIQHHTTRHSHILLPDCTRPVELHEYAPSISSFQVPGIYAGDHKTSGYHRKKSMNILKRHMLLNPEHADHSSKEWYQWCQRKSDIEWYQCENCPFRSKRKGDLKRHVMDRHTHPSDIKWHQCDHCPYKAKQKGHLKRHLIGKHSFPSDVKWYQCQICPYKSKLKASVTRHVLYRHAHASEIEWYHCENCPYKSKEKGDLKTHVIMSHSHPSDIEWYQCQNCPFKAKRKGDMNRHATEKHTHPSDVKWHECENCSYKSKRKRDVRRHTKKRHSLDVILNGISRKSVNTRERWAKGNLNRHATESHVISD